MPETSNQTRLFDFLQDGRTLIVVPRGDLGEFLFHEIEEQAQPILARLGNGDARDVVVDMQAVHYSGSTALSFLVKLWKRVRDRNGQMAICNVSADELSILKATGLDTVWPVCDSRSAALTLVATRKLAPDGDSA